MPTLGSACAKFIVLGEHSILHGGQAVVYPLKELTLRFSLSDENPGPGSGPSLNGKFLERWQIEKLSNVMSAMHVEADVKQIVIESDIPIGKGLGSSAALCVAMARRFFPDSSATSIAKLAMAGESVFHGKSSGVDPYTIALEQPLAYRMENSEHRPLNLSSHASHVFLLRDSGTEHATDEAIKKVTALKASNSAVFHSIIDGLKVNAGLGLKLIESGDFDRLGLLLQDSNRLLFELGLGSPALENAIKSLLQEGALGAKVTGAGLGGYVFGLFPEHRLPKNLRSGDLIVRCSGS